MWPKDVFSMVCLCVVRIYILRFKIFVHLLFFHFFISDWRVCDLFGHLSTVCQRMGIWFWLLLHRKFRVFLL